MQIYVPAALLYRVQPRLLFKIPDSSAVWKRLQFRLQCRLQCRIQYRIQCRICYEVTLPRTLSRMGSRLKLGNPELHNTMTIDDYKSTSESSTSNQYSLRRHMRLVAGGATTFKRGGWPCRNRKQPLTQTITVPEVQERSTVRFIHQLRRLAVASAPRDESTWTQRTTISAPSQVMASTPTDESTSTPAGDPASTPCD